MGHELPAEAVGWNEESKSLAKKGLRTGKLRREPAHVARLLKWCILWEKIMVMPSTKSVGESKQTFYEEVRGFVCQVGTTFPYLQSF